MPASPSWIGLGVFGSRFPESCARPSALAHGVHVHRRLQLALVLVVGGRGGDNAGRDVLLGIAVDVLVKVLSRKDARLAGLFPARNRARRRERIDSASSCILYRRLTAKITSPQRPTSISLNEFSLQRSPLFSVEQNLAARRAAFANAGDVDGRVLLQRAGVLARAAAHAAAGIDARLLQRLRVARRVDHLRLLHINGLGRNRAPLFADNAIGGHGPRQAAAAVIECRAQANRLALLAHAHHPAFILGRDLPDGAGGADLRAEHATGLAVADARHQRRRPQSFQPRLIERGMQRNVGADLHALAAADAARKKIGFVQRARRPQQPLVAALAQAGVGAHQRNNRRAGRKAGERPAPAQIRRGNFFLLAEETGIAGRRAGNCPRSSCTSGTRPCATARRRWDRRRPGSGAGSGCSCRRPPRPCAAPARTSARPRPAARPAGKSPCTTAASRAGWPPESQ